MAYGIALRVWGKYACFTRPEMKVERVSYDVMTPSAARGILEAIYWKPAIRWEIKRIHTINPIRFTNIRRNELAGKIPMGTVKRAMNDLSTPVETFIEDDRQQRAAMVLENVEYVIEATLGITEKAGKHDSYGNVDPSDKEPSKHLEIFKRRASTGQCFTQPYFGTREFSVNFKLIEPSAIPSSSIAGERDLGWMLHDIDFTHDMAPRFFHALLKNGIVDVPAFESMEVRG